MRINLIAANDACIQDFLDEMGNAWFNARRQDKTYSETAYSEYLCVLTTLSNSAMFTVTEVIP